MRKKLSSLILAAGVLVTPTLAADPTESMLANPCAGCHGTDGYSQSAMPRIAGFNEKLLVQIMKNYQTDARTSTIMGRLAKGYTEEQLVSIAKFFSKQEWQSPEQEVDAKLVAEGEKIHKEKCTTCHQDNGKTGNDSVPRIAGQWLDYLEIVMDEYLDPEVKMPENAMVKMMKMQMTGLKPEDVAALAHFYASQK